MNKVRFAIVGFGNIGKRHAQHILQNENAELVSICSLEPEPEGLNSPYFQNLDEMLNTIEADVLNVCTPNDLHCEHTLKGLDQHLHVVCEKPMAMSVPECNRMIDQAEKNKKQIFVVKQNRYNQPVQEVKKLIENNILGKIFLVNINCFWNRNEQYYKSDWRGYKRRDGGCLFTQFSHFVDIMYYLFGKVQIMDVHFKNYAHDYIEIEDCGIVNMQTKNGTMINLNYSTCSHEKNMEGAFTILAEKGTVKIGGQYLNTIEYQNILGHQIPDIHIQEKANEYGFYQGSMSNHDRIIENVVAHLKSGEKIMTNAYEGRDVIEIIENIYQKQRIQ